MNSLAEFRGVPPFGGPSLAGPAGPSLAGPAGPSMFGMHVEKGSVGLAWGGTGFRSSMRRPTEWHSASSQSLGRGPPVPSTQAA